MSKSVNIGDAFGDRMKEYEMVEAGRKFMKLLPVVARLDGKCFSKFTKGLARPYDARLSELMFETTRYLVKETNAVMGYTQSDEITLAWYSYGCKSQIFFDGRVQKMTSVLSAMASAFFNKNLPKYIPEKADKMPLFDARVWQVPNLDEAANAFLWREKDATKNSISMAASGYYSHKQLMGKSSNDKLDMLLAKGILWNLYPEYFKRGLFVQKRTASIPYSLEEVEKLPPRHEARFNPLLEIERTVVIAIDMPPFSKVSNRVDVIFLGADPVPFSE